MQQRPPHSLFGNLPGLTQIRLADGECAQWRRSQRNNLNARCRNVRAAAWVGQSYEMTSLGCGANTQQHKMTCRELKVKRNPICWREAESEWEREGVREREKRIEREGFGELIFSNKYSNKQKKIQFISQQLQYLEKLFKLSEKTTFSEGICKYNTWKKKNTSHHLHFLMKHISNES